MITVVRPGIHSPRWTSTFVSFVSTPIAALTRSFSYGKTTSRMALVPGVALATADGVGRGRAGRP